MKIPTFPDGTPLKTGKREFKHLEPEVPAPAPDWWVAPANVKPLTRLEDFPIRADAYFQDCDNREERATITGFCVAIGLPGPTSLLRLGQRVPELRAMISRCCTRIAAGYEAMIGSGQSAGPIFMLKNIPDFDPEDPEGAPAVLFFEDRKEIVFNNVSGAANAGDEFTGDALETYLSIIKRSKPRQLKQSQSELGDYSRPQRMLRILSSEEVDSQQSSFIEGETVD